MKTIKYIIIALALGICSAGATLIVHEDSLKAFDVTLDWHDLLSSPYTNPGEPLGYQMGSYYGISNIATDWLTRTLVPGAEEQLILVQLYAISPWLPIVNQVGQFQLTYSPYPANQTGLEVFMNDSVDKIKIAHDFQSVRLTWKANVPDAGSSLLLFSMALGMLGIAKWKI